MPDKMKNFVIFRSIQEKSIQKKRCELGLYWRRCGGLPTKDFMLCIEFNFKNEESAYVVYVGKLKTPRLTL